MHLQSSLLNNKIMNRPTILVTNDDGFFAKGFKTLIEIAKPFGKVIAVAPETSQSGMSHALTFKNPVRLVAIEKTEDVEIYSLTGTPVDCVKMALDRLLEDKPALLLSGINHGSNSSISAIYSGTVATAREGCLNGIPSVAFSHLDYTSDANFEFIMPYATEIVKGVLDNGLKSGIFLNVNFPHHDIENFKGLKVCRQARGVWVEEFLKREDPLGREYFWLTGDFNNFEENEKDTDEWALQNNYGSVVPLRVELTAFEEIEGIKKWGLEN